MQRPSNTEAGPWIARGGYPFEVIEIYHPFSYHIRVTQEFLNSSPRYLWVWDTRTEKWRPRKPPEFGMHKGVDFALPPRTAIYAPVAGILDWGFEPQKAGIWAKVLFEHQKKRMEVFMAHLSDVLLSKRASIGSGAKIALSGETGNSTGPHLHLEVREFGPKTPYPFKFKD